MNILKRAILSCVFLCALAVSGFAQSASDITVSGTLFNSFNDPCTSCTFTVTVTRRDGVAVQATPRTVTGAGGSLIFQTAAASTTGSTQNALTTRFSIDSNGAAAHTPATTTGTGTTAGLSVVANSLTTGNGVDFSSSSVTSGALITIVLVQDGTGSRTVTWPGTVKWTAATAPTLTTTASKRDVFTFVYDGSNYYNASQQLNQ